VNDSICYSRCYNIVKLKRLNSITSVFLCSMIALVESESVIVVLLSWDLLGVTSYLLVQYYNRSVRINNVMSINTGLRVNHLNPCISYNLWSVIVAFWYLLYCDRHRDYTSYSLTLNITSHKLKRNERN